MLDARKTKALELMLKGVTITEIAKEIDVNRSTIYEWLKTDADFLAAKEELEKKLLDGLFTISLYETEELLVNGKSHEKVAMVQMLNKINVGEKTNISVDLNKITIDDILKTM